MTSVRDATLRLLRDLGMTTVFGNPGSTELPLFRDFPGDFRYVLGLQESVVVGMADGYAQATRNAAFVSLHSAAGVGHALGNLFTAFRNRTPLVVTAGQQARSILPYDPFLYAMQATEFPRPYVKYSVEPARAADVPAAIARAYFTAMQPPAGPTFVSIPVDDWDCAAELHLARRAGTAGRPEANLLDQLAETLVSAQAPAFVVGAGVDRDGGWDLMIRLAERFGALVYVSPMSARCSFPEDHPLHAGFLPAFREQIVARLVGHDVIVVWGAPVFPYHAEGFGPHIPQGATLFQVTEDPELAAWAPVGTALVCGVRHALEDLESRPAVPSHVVQSGRSRTPRVCIADPLTDAMVMQSLQDLRPADSIIVEEAPSSRSTMQLHLPIVRPCGFYTCASGGLGHGLPAAVGVALANRTQRVIGLMGDGSSMYSIQALWTAAQLALPMTFIILNNGRYQALHSFANLFGIDKPVGTTLPGIDFAGLARAQGCEAMRIDRASHLASGLAAALGSARPMLVDIAIA